MVTKINFNQYIEDNKSTEEYNEENLEQLDRKLYGDENPEEIFECATYKINQNFWYVLGSDIPSRKMFDIYLKSHNPELSRLFLAASTENPPEFMLQDSSVKSFLLRKFHNNPDYGIFNVEDGKIKIRRMNNREVIYKLEKFVVDMYRINGPKYLDNLDKIKNKTEQVKKKLYHLMGEKISLESSLSFGPKSIAIEEEIEALQKQILFGPLWME